jgi:hypothetical protein
MKEHLQFWAAYQEYMAKNSTIRCQKPQSRHWMNHSIGWPSDIHLTSIISTRKPKTCDSEIRVELGLLGAKGKQRFDVLKLQQAKIERECGVPVIWHSPPDGKEMHKIYVSKDTDFRQTELWAEQQQWLKANLELFQRVFDPIIKQLEWI